MIDTAHGSHPLFHLLDGIEVLVCGLDTSGRILHVNRYCEEVTGLAREKAIGQNWVEIFALHERRERVVELWQQSACLRASEPFESLCRNNRRIRWRFSPWRASADDQHGLCAFGIDVTQERRALERARAAERTIALAHLSAGLAHEIRNPLNSAKLQLELAARQLVRSDVNHAQGAIALASGEITRAGQLLDDFLVFARPKELELARIDLRATAQAAVDLARSSSRQSVQIELEQGPPLEIEGDGERLMHAIKNLLTNAIDAAAGGAAGGRVVVRLFARENVACVEVEDNGAGLPSADAPIFEAFFTTKPSGTGLGLAIVQRAAFEHGGTIACERRHDKTVFLLRLPIVFGGAA